MDQKLAVVAIDFGTTYSGWAFSFLHEYQSDPTKVYSPHWYPGETDPTYKAPTTILIKPDGKNIEAFGYEAENKFSEWKTEGTHDDYFFFSKFKMALNLDLKSAKDLDSVEIKDLTGRPLNALTVCSLTIQYLYQDGEKHILERINTGLCPSDIRWVLTVPAIWTDAAKRFMRKAAIQAGIPSDRLTFALEPEAAAVLYKHLPLTVGTSGFKEFKTGERYMVLDAGGGTVDITVHEIDRIGGIKEVIAANGGGWGGNLVNDAFHAFFERLYQDGIYKTFKQEHGEEWLEFDRGFERKKRTIDQSCKGLTLTCQYSLMAETPRAGTVSIKKKKIQIEGDTAKAFFMSSIVKMVEHLTTLLQRPELEGVSSILMAGGFSDSPILKESLKDIFPNLEFICPPEAGLSILKGAVIFGHNPSVITGRVLKYTYGVKTCVPFEEGKHEESKKFNTDKGVHCKDIFNKHAEIYQAVKVGEPQQEQTYRPINHNQKSMTLNVFASENKNPKYVNLLGCVTLGEFKVDMSDLNGDLDRTVTCRFTFGDTEILVDATCVKTGKKAEFKRSYLE